ncbi:MAG: hypothetical protein SO434_07565 [Eubacteriales bacterium]|nr:hypothetical protein [Eubacteriales bacterium]
MHLRAAKVYFDGSHYTAIPPNAFPHRKKKSKTAKKEYKQKEEIVPNSNSPPNVQKEKFETAYKESLSLPKKERKSYIEKRLADTFSNEEELKTFVDENIERAKTNSIRRIVRLYRKINLQKWDYFVTFTYSNELHTEESFRKKLSNTLKHLVSRKGWKYVGVWERGGDTDRLHFHGIFHIPKDSMIGKIVEVEDYDTKNHRRQKILQNTHFLKHFGRNDFRKICLPDDVSSAVKYITKYMEKSGEKLVYGGKLPTYFLSDILEEDIICPIGVDDRKALLFDNFMCIDEGTIMGNVSPEIIEQMPKCN